MIILISRFLLFTVVESGPV